MNIKKYKNAKGEVRYKYNAYLGINPLTGKEKRTNRQGFLTHREAERDYFALISGQNQTKDNTTFEAAYQAWRSLYETTVKGSTLQLVSQMFQNHILPVFGCAPIQKISYQDVQKFINKKATEMKAYKKISTYMSLVFKHAMRLGIISSNPCDLIIYPKTNHPTRKIPTWSIQDIKKFLDYTKTDLPFQWHLFFYLIIITGMRRGEALALHWEDIDGDVINIRHSLSRGMNGIVLSTPKTKSSERQVVIDEYAIKLLKRQKIEQFTAFGDIPMIFNNSKRSYLATSFPMKRLTDVIQKRNLPPMTIHGLRHTNASILYFEGSKSKVIQERLGHASDKITLDTYTHTPLDEQRSSVHHLSKTIHALVTTS